MLEKELEARLRDRVEAAGGRCEKWTCPGFGGVPDRIVLLPGGVVVFVETKRPKGGRLSGLQKWWARWLTGNGHNYAQVWTPQGLDQFCRDWLA